MKRTIFKSVTAAILTLIGAVMINNSIALAQSQVPRDHWWGMHPMMGYGMGWMGMFMMIIFWGLIIVGGIILIRWLIQSSPTESGGGNKALSILKERYARGEISKDEFESMKRDLDAP